MPHAAPRVLQRACACGTHTREGTCGSCRARAEAPRPGIAAVQAAPPIVDTVLGSPGHPLDAATRGIMEPRFGRDFSGIRVHTDARAADSARAVAARAYTVGRDIVFASGQFSPGSDAGLRLLAHELTHTVQQGPAAPHIAGKLEVTGPADGSEREADAVAEIVMRGGSAPAVGPAPVASVQRQLDEGLRRRAGGTLPYREATELAKCIQIMGNESAEYCREEVLGEKPPPRCPTAHTIPDDVYAAIGAAWAKSGHGGATVTEHGGRIVTDKAGRRVIRTGSGGGGSITYPAEQAGDVTTGTLHTHPYSAAEHSRLGVAFSGGDITNFIKGDQGSVKYVGAGTCYFALDTLNFVSRDACQKVDTTKRWNDAFAAASGTFQERVETAVKATIAGCGLCFYKTCRPDDKSPVPKDATLA